MEKINIWENEEFLKEFNKIRMEIYLETARLKPKEFPEWIFGEQIEVSYKSNEE